MKDKLKFNSSCLNSKKNLDGSRCMTENEAKLIFGAVTCFAYDDFPYSFNVSVQDCMDIADAASVNMYGEPT